jgi:chorismate mutase
MIQMLTHIPAGMEDFAADTDEQWKVIQRVIDDSDYYVLIIGNRYGSTTPEGLSYTEREFDYAIESRLPVFVFPHGDPGSISSYKSDSTDESRMRLEAFRKKAMNGRMVKQWWTGEGLAMEVGGAIANATKSNPRIGWVRSNTIPDEVLRKELEEARRKLREQAITFTEVIEQMKSTQAKHVETIGKLNHRLEAMKTVADAKNSNSPTVTDTSAPTDTKAQPVRNRVLGIW